jgi:hypothetical protein
MNESINNIKNDVMFTIQALPNDSQDVNWRISALMIGLNLNAKVGFDPLVSLTANTAFTLVFRYY